MLFHYLIEKNNFQEIINDIKNKITLFNIFKNNEKFLLLQEKIFDNFSNLMILWIIMMKTHVQFLALKINYLIRIFYSL